MKQVALLVAVISIAEVVQAGPDETTNFLMDDAASMLDFGLLRINLTLESRNLGSADFSWDENRIRILPPVSMVMEDYASISDAEDACRTWVSQVRMVAGINAKTGKPYVENTRFSDYFLHFGFSRSNSPISLLTDLDKLMTIECIGIAESTKVSVAAPLLGLDVFVSKQPL